jgi:hypothetical protein
MTHLSATREAAQPAPAVEHRRCGALIPGDFTQHAGGACSCDSPDLPFIVVAVTPAGEGSIEVTWMHEPCGTVSRPVPCHVGCEVEYQGHTGQIPDHRPGLVAVCAYEELLNRYVDVGTAGTFAQNIAARVACILQARPGRPILTVIRRAATAELTVIRRAATAELAGRYTSAEAAAGIADGIARRAEAWMSRPRAARIRGGAKSAEAGRAS